MPAKGAIPQPINHVVAGRVRQAREAKGWSQAEVARRLTNAGAPMTQTALARLEGNRRGVLVEELVAIARVLEVPLVWLVIDTASAVAQLTKPAPTPSFDALLWAIGRRWPEGNERVPDSWTSAAIPIRRAVAAAEQAEQAEQWASWSRSPAIPKPDGWEDDYRGFLGTLAAVLGAVAELGMSLPVLDARVVEDAERLGVDLLAVREG